MKMASISALFSSLPSSAGMPSVRESALSLASPEKSSARDTVPDLSSSHWSNTRRILLSSLALQLGFGRVSGTLIESESKFIVDPSSDIVKA